MGTRVNTAESGEDQDDTKYFFIIYISLGGANTLFTFMRAFLFAYSGIIAGKRIHETLMKNLHQVSLKAKR
jgi:hypothetical protein